MRVLEWFIAHWDKIATNLIAMAALIFSFISNRRSYKLQKKLDDLAKPDITLDTFTDEVFFFTDEICEKENKKVYTFIVVGAFLTNRSVKSNTITNFDTSSFNVEKNGRGEKFTQIKGNHIRADFTEFKKALNKIKIKEFYKDEFNIRLDLYDSENIWQYFNHDKYLTSRLPLYIKDGASEKLFFIILREGPPPDPPNYIQFTVELSHSRDKEPFPTFSFDVTKQVS
jgi:hypothetical protein